MNDEPDVTLVYDGQCPVCRYYAGKIDLAQGEFVRVDAREACALTNELESQGYDLDEGMVLQVGDRCYYGSEALHELALRSSDTGLFNRLVSRPLRSSRLARLLYPPMTVARSVLLRLLGRTKIRDRNDSANRSAT